MDAIYLIFAATSLTISLINIYKTRKLIKDMDETYRNILKNDEIIRKRIEENLEE